MLKQPFSVRFRQSQFFSNTKAETCAGEVDGAGAGTGLNFLQRLPCPRAILFPKVTGPARETSSQL